MPNGRPEHRRRAIGGHPVLFQDASATVVKDMRFLSMSQGGACEWCCVQEVAACPPALCSSTAACSAVQKAVLRIHAMSTPPTSRTATHEAAP
eukprot:277276-Chlamydomonas_euryale.AAC.2